MSDAVLTTLDSAALAIRLCGLAGGEREIQADFLLSLAEFDSRRAYLEIGYGSLWEYCLRALHLREGATARRIAAMKVLRRFPRLEPALRDGRLSLSTLALLGTVLTEENVDELAARAAWMTKAQVDHLVASVQPRAAPRDGLRKIPDPARRAESPARSLEMAPCESHAMPVAAAPEQTEPGALVSDIAPPRAEPPAERHRAVRAEMRAVSEDEWSLRVTLDSETTQELERLRALLGHKVPNGDLAGVLREVIRCGIEKHGKRKGAVAPAKPRRSAGSTPARAAGEKLDPTTIPADVRRQVWERDGGRCAWTAPDGRRCDCTWKLEFDHIISLARGGTSTVENLRLLCRAHNLLHAEQVYGRKHMEKFRREGTSRSGEFTAAGSSEGGYR